MLPVALENGSKGVGQLRRDDALHRTRKVERVLRVFSRHAPTLRRRAAGVPHEGPELQRLAAVVDDVVVPRAVVGTAETSAAISRVRDGSPATRYA